MSKTLFWYIFKDLLRIFFLTLGVLAGIMSFGGLLRPLTEHGLNPGQVFRMLGYFLPAMATYSLPVAALFATTMVYGRLSADNEITACRAAGISALSISQPAVVLGGVVTLISFVFLFFIVPVFSLKVEKVIYSNMAQLVQNQIERNHRIEFDQGPGSSPLTIFAQQARVLPPPPDRPKEQLVQLFSPVFVRYDTPERANRNRPVPPADFLMAKTALAYIAQDSDTGELFLQTTLQDAIKIPRRVTGGKDQPMQMKLDTTGFYPDPMESPIRENTKFMSWDRLRELLQKPEDSKRMRQQLASFIRTDQINGYLKELYDALDQTGSVNIATETESYVIQRGAAKLDIHNGRLIVGTPEEPTTAPATNPATKPATILALSQQPKLIETQGGELNASARVIQVRVTPIGAVAHSPEEQKQMARQSETGEDKPQRRFNVEITLDDATVNTAGSVSQRIHFPRPLNVPMPAALVALEKNKIENYRHDYKGPSKTADTSQDRLMQLERNFIKLTNSIKSEIHARASFSVSCWVLVLVGCALGMMFRSGNFLSAFALSVVPAMMSILLIITGQHTCENVPWDITKFNNPLEFGIHMIWTGNVIVSILAIVLLGRLQRQ